MDAAPQSPPQDGTPSAFHATPGSLRFRVIAYNPETRQDEDCGIIEAKSWEAAASTVRCRYNYPKRMIPVLADVIEFPSPANTQAGRRPLPSGQATCSAGDNQG